MEQVKNENLKYEAILFALKDAGIAEIEYEYNGSGDDGAIDYINLIDQKGNVLNFDSETDKEIHDLVAKLEDHVYEILGNVSDWCNNDGGYGTVSLYTDTGNYVVNNNIRITSYEHEEYSGHFPTFVDYRSHDKNYCKSHNKL